MMRQITKRLLSLGIAAVALVCVHGCQTTPVVPDPLVGTWQVSSEAIPQLTQLLIEFDDTGFPVNVYYTFAESGQIRAPAPQGVGEILNNEVHVDVAFNGCGLLFDGDVDVPGDGIIPGFMSLYLEIGAEIIQIDDVAATMTEFVE